MPGPYRETSIVMEFSIDSPEQFFRFHPPAPEGDRWLHRFEEFDAGMDRDEVIDHYSLQPSDDYRVSIVTVPGGNSMRIGSVAGLHGHSGGGDLVEVLDHEAIPESWVDETMSLDDFLEQTG